MARDKLGVLRSSTLRLSEEAGRVLALLLSQSQAEQKNATAPAAALGDEEAATLVKALVERSRRTEDLGQEGSPLYALLELAKAKPSTASEVMAFLEGMPVKGLPIRLPVQLRGLGQAIISIRPNADALITRWAANTENTQLAQAAKRAATAEVIVSRSRRQSI